MKCVIVRVIKKYILYIHSAMILEMNNDNYKAHRYIIYMVIIIYLRLCRTRI